MSKREQLKEYLYTKVNSIVEKMVLEILKNKPENLHDFMIEFLQKDKLNQGSTQENLMNAYGEYSDEEEEEVEDIPVVLKPKQKMRQSVSAEAFGQFNQKKEFVPVVVEKNQETYDRIVARLSNSFMFSALEDKDKDIVVKAMSEHKFTTGQNVIQQGEEGAVLYVIDSGELDCFKTFAEGEEPKHLKVYQPGESFGELALLYNAPRAATITAKTDSVLFALDRDTFNNIVKDAAQKKRDVYDAFLQKVELLSTIEPYERTQLADALKPMTFKAGEFVVKEGDHGDVFFLIEEGEAQAMKVITPGGEPECVLKYSQNDYFGELALLKSAPRAASIVASTDLKLATLDRMSFKRLLGPLEDLLKRNFSRYEKFVN